jgi:hypothetical protein
MHHKKPKMHCALSKKHSVNERRLVGRIGSEEFSDRILALETLAMEASISLCWKRVFCASFRDAVSNVFVSGALSTTRSSPALSGDTRSKTSLPLFRGS